MIKNIYIKYFDIYIKREREREREREGNRERDIHTYIDTYGGST